MPFVWRCNMPACRQKAPNFGYVRRLNPELKSKKHVGCKYGEYVALGPMDIDTYEDIEYEIRLDSMHTINFDVSRHGRIFQMPRGKYLTRDMHESRIIVSGALEQLRKAIRPAPEYTYQQPKGRVKRARNV